MLKLILGAAALAAAASAATAQRAGTVGDCISDGFYGNEPNIEGPYAPGGPSEQEPGTKGGRVVPSQSPGPFVNNPLDPDNPTRGSSVGDINQTFGGGALPEFCRTLTQ